jgi:LmbE family N-acetylglucosaminyl deacetylase/mannose/fructose/N-acetylgalactosamine-specific phosphotransferase system component IIB
MQYPVGRKQTKLTAIAAAVLVAVVGLLMGHAAVASAATANCSAGSTMIIVAHEDDSLLFLSPDLIHAAQNGRCVRTVFLTAGDDGNGKSYWSSREQGVEAAYAEIAGVANTWTQSDAGIAGHPIPVMTLSADPNLSLAFMRLPDGNLDGSGFASQGYASLQKLYTGTIPQMTTVDGTSSYTLGALISTVSSLVTSFNPDTIWTQDYAGSYGDGDHSDHHTVAYLTREISRAWTTTTHTLTGYMDYTTEQEPANVTGSDLTAKEDAWFSYTPFDSMVCQTEEACQPTGYGSWLQAQYTVGTETDGPGKSYAPVAFAGPNQTVGGGATIQLDGSASSDPGGNPSYKWTQTGGPSVTLSSSTGVKPTFAAPSAASTLTFQLVVTDGSQTSAPSTVTVTVTPASTDLALASSVTASSQNTSTGQTAAKAIDGVIDGYPGDYTKEWATAGGGAGSWLKLTWTGAQTINDVVLYDRPNTNDQVTGGTLTFSDGSTVNVPSLNNNGAATTVTFPAKTTTSVLFTVTSVSSTTTNVGLAEIEIFAPQSGGGGNNAPPTADAGADQVVSTGATVQLDGSASYDPGGNPSYQWTQTSGPAVTLSNPTSVKPTFTAPSGATSLTFQLVVADGSQTSDPSSVTIAVKEQEANVAPQASVTASSQNTSTGQTAAKAIDGVIDGYPGDYTKEWATVGGGAGSWLKLAWTSPQTINKVVLYDRPNANDQVTGGTLAFSDGTTVNVPSLNNDGSATTVTFPAVTTTSLLFTVTSVSSTTFNVGLAEIEVYPTGSGGSVGAPTANAGPDQSIATGASVQLDGSGSTDPGGNPSYQWTQTAGPSVTLSSSTTVKPTFTAPSTATTLTFQLVVTDGSQSSQPSTVNIKVNPPNAPTANAGPDQSVTAGASVQLDGSGSTDPGGNPSYQWTQTAGPSVTLSSSTTVKPTFTAPSTAATLTFQLTVTDGSQSSQDTVNITVSPPDLALQASATASSQNTSTGQTALKAIDGVIDGYPGDYTKEWATTGGGAGSWLKLTWTSAQTISRVVLYDRPNANDQVTAGTLTFSDGSTVNVPSLNNDGSATTVTFPAKSTTSLLFTITSVSSTTQNVGLSEIQVYSS